MRGKRILVVERHAHLRQMLQLALSDAYRVDITESIEEADAESRHSTHVAFVIGVGIGQERALKLIGKLRRLGDERPIITLSDPRQRDLPVLCYKAGSDCNIVKVGSQVTGEIMAAMARLIRRARLRAKPFSRTSDMPLPTKPFRFAGALIDPQTMTLRFSAKSHAALNAKELAVLHFFATRNGRLARRNELVAAVWGESLHPRSNSPDTYLWRLRTLYDKHGIDLRTYLQSKARIGWVVRKRGG